MIAREIESIIRRDMGDYPSVTLYGPRQCGKTTLVRSMFTSFSYANLEVRNVRMLAENDPDEFFTQFPEPVIIDEIQRVPDLVSAIQVRIDESGHKKGQYVLTGSQQIKVREAVTQSLAGRTSIVRMLPLSLRELARAGITLDRDTQILAGFMPYLFSEKGFSPSSYYENYIATYLERDIAGQKLVTDIDRFTKFLILLAGRTGQLVNNSAIASEVGVSSTTISSWMSLLLASHIILRLKPWSTSRTSQEVKSAKVYFCDTGIASNLLGITTPSQLFRDPLNGSLFENMVVVEAFKAIMNTGGRTDDLYFYRNSNGLEVDLVHSVADRLDLFEIKSGKALDKNWIRGMHTLEKKIGKQNCTVIYSGENCIAFDGARFMNFHDIAELFENREELFRLDF